MSGTDTSRSAPVDGGVGGVDDTEWSFMELAVPIIANLRLLVWLPFAAALAAS